MENLWRKLTFRLVGEVDHVTAQAQPS